MKSSKFFVGALLLLSTFILYQCTPKAAVVIQEETAAPNAVQIEEETPSPVPPPQMDKQKIPFDPEVRRGQLDNGLKYYIRKNAKPENRAELRLVVHAGSMQEDDDQLGLAHFVEHMCFNGSRNFEKNELVDYLELAGTRFGPDLNAYTSFDETVYMLQVRTDDQELFDTGLLVLEDWAQGVSFDHEEIDKERGVVESEWRTRLSGEQRMQKEYFPVMYKNSRYAERLPIGDPEIIKNADYETIKRFYRDWYRPDLMAVIVVGDFDLESVESEIKTRFSKLVNPANPRPRKDYEVPGHEETLISITSDPEVAFARVNLMIKHKSKDYKTLADFRQRLVQNLYNRMLGNRLSEIAKQADPPFMFGYSGYGGDVGKLDTYRSFAQFSDGKAMDALETLLIENERVLKHGFNQSELERAKTILLENYDRRYKEKDKTDSRRWASTYVYSFLDNRPILGAEDEMNYANEFIDGIQLSEINALAEKWITNENRFILISGPEKEDAPLPTEEEVRQVLESVKQLDIEPYEDEVIDQPLFTENLVAVDIIGEKNHEETDVREYTLANGVRVITKKTDFKNNEILFGATSEGGSSLYPDEDYFSASHATRIVQESGLGEFNSIQLQKLLTGKTVRVSPYIGSRLEGMNGSCAPEDMETMFQLIYMYFNSPRKDEEAFQSYLSREKGFFSNLKSNPQFYFMDFAQEVKYGDQIRIGLPELEDYDKIDMNRAFEIYQERFADASDFTFIFVGNFDHTELKDHAQLYLGNLPSINRSETWKDLGINIKKGKIEKTLNKGKAPKTQVELFFHGDFDWSFKNQHKFQSMIEVLRIKMRESMREDKGGVYGVGVRGYATQYPKPRYSITISFNCDPDKTDELIETAMNDIHNAKLNGAEEKDLEKVKETQRQSMIKNLKENRYWNNRIRYFNENGLDFNNITLEFMDQYINSLTSDDIKTASNTFFNDGNFIKLVMMPEKVDN